MPVSHLVPVGTAFPDRESVRAAGLHKHTMAGIGYEPGGAAELIVVSGGYREDEDFGDRIIYTGQGGQSAPGSGKQVSDQTLDRGNQALVVSALSQLPVRVIRGSGGNKEFSPASGYRYDGLFLVTTHWFDVSQDGPLVIRFVLEKSSDGADRESVERVSAEVVSGPPQGHESPGRTEKPSTSSVDRNPALPSWIKTLYKDQCQLCMCTLTVPALTFSHGAHIQGLGHPHNGKDLVDNMLCLCPNCHIRLDYGAIYIQDDCLTAQDVITGSTSKLHVHPAHSLDLPSIQYHRLHVDVSRVL